MTPKKHEVDKTLKKGTTSVTLHPSAAGGCADWVRAHHPCHLLHQPELVHKYEKLQDVIYSQNRKEKRGEMEQIEGKRTMSEQWQNLQIGDQ